MTPPLRTRCPLSSFRLKSHTPTPAGSACWSSCLQVDVTQGACKERPKAVCSALERPWGLNEFCIFIVSYQHRLRCGFNGAARRSAPARGWKCVHNKLKNQMGSERAQSITRQLPADADIVLLRRSHALRIYYCVREPVGKKSL